MSASPVSDASTAPRRLWALQARFAPYLFLLPFILLFCIFLLYPLITSIWMSAFQYATPQTNRFVGLGNYRFFLTDKLFWLAVANTVMFTLLIVGLQIPLSLGLALLLNNPRVRWRNVFRFAFFSSHLVGHVFVAVIFRMILSQRHGLLAKFLGLFSFGLSEINWLGHPVWGRLAIVIAVLWVSVGWSMVYFLAALQSVDQELYEAAQIDGANRWQRFWHVTFPGIRPVLIFLTVVCTIGSFQIFELPYILFDSNTGPGQAGLTIVMYLYMNGFDLGDIGAASAVGWLLALLIFGVSLIQLKITKATRED